MKARQATELGERLAGLVRAGQIEPACAMLSPVLAERTPFDMLRRIGGPVGGGPLEPVNGFLERVAADETMGGWVIIASALEAQLERDLPSAFACCRAYIVAADAWYAADTLGEGVPGRALVRQFRPALDLLAGWREDANPWVRRAVGVAVHHWAKRSRGAAEHTDRAGALLDLLTPMFEEWEMDAVKGVGWGLKTLGKHYPDLVASWLAEQMGRRHRAIMRRKALTYLSKEQRARAVGETTD